MRHDTVRPGAVARSGDHPLRDLTLDPETWQEAWQAHLDEDYETSLAVARRCLDEVDAGKPAPLSLVPESGSHAPLGRVPAGAGMRRPFRSDAPTNRLRDLALTLPSDATVSDLPLQPENIISYDRCHLPEVLIGTVHMSATDAATRSATTAGYSE